MTILLTHSEFLLAICGEKVAKEICLKFQLIENARTWGLSHVLMSKKPAQYLLDNDDFNVNVCRIWLRKNLVNLVWRQPGMIRWN